MRKSKILIVCITVILMTIILCSCNKQKEKITLSESTLDKISEIEDKYGVTINYCNVPVEENIKFEYEIASNADEIAEAVEAVEIILNRLPDDWSEMLMNPSLDLQLVPEMEEIQIVLCNDMEDYIDSNNVAISRKGEAICADTTVYLMVDIHNHSPKEAVAYAIVDRILDNVIHDDRCVLIYEAIETYGDNYTEYLNLKQIPLFDEYAKLNPQDFTYYGQIKEISENHNKYVYSGEADKENIYFINKESMYSEYLDCLHMIAPLLYTDENDTLPEAFYCLNVQKKIECTLSKFDVRLFHGITYWHRWFE